MNWVRLTPGTEDNDYIHVCKKWADGDCIIQSGWQDKDGINADDDDIGTTITPAEALAFTIATGNWREVPKVRALVAQMQKIRTFAGHASNGSPDDPMQYVFDEADRALAGFDEVPA